MNNIIIINVFPFTCKIQYDIIFGYMRIKLLHMLDGIMWESLLPNVADNDAEFITTTGIYELFKLMSINQLPDNVQIIIPNTYINEHNNLPIKISIENPYICNILPLYPKKLTSIQRNIIQQIRCNKQYMKKNDANNILL